MCNIKGFVSIVLDPLGLHNQPVRPLSSLPIRHPKAPTLTCDQRRDCQLLHSIGWSYSQIRTQTGYTVRQIGLACQKRATPQKSTGRPPILSQAQVEELVEFVCASSKNRRMSFQQLAEVMDFGVKKQAIRSALLQEGFHRRLAMRKPPITEKNRRLREA